MAEKTVGTLLGEFRNLVGVQEETVRDSISPVVDGVKNIRILLRKVADSLEDL